MGGPSALAAGLHFMKRFTTDASILEIVPLGLLKALHFIADQLLLPVSTKCLPSADVSRKLVAPVNVAASCRKKRSKLWANEMS